MLLFRRGAELGLNAQQRVAILKVISETSLYGLLFLSAFSFSREVTIENDHLLQKYENTEILSIGIHTRHQNSGDSGTDVNAALECVQKILDKNEARLPCVLFVASDRIATIETLQNASSGLNCDVVVSKRTVQKTWLSEHGPWANSGSTLLDVELLSRADYFIGSPGSSFSWFIEEIFAYNNLLSPAEEAIKWESLHHCTDGKARYAFPHPDSLPPLNCSNSINITLSHICPNYVKL